MLYQITTLMIKMSNLRKMRQDMLDWRLICMWIIISWTRPTSTTVTVTAYDGTGIVQQQPLTLGCNYTKGGSDVIINFDWRLEEDVILSGSFNDQTAGFQPGFGWESGVFLGDYTSSLTIQLPVSSVTPSVAGQYTCRVSGNGAAQDTATATVQYAPQIKSNFPSKKAVTEFSRLQINCSSYTTPGNPSTHYTWTHLGSTDISGAILDMNNIGRDRRGQYTCTASNTIGSDSETVSVDVQYAPQIESTFPSSRTVTEFSRLQINCSSYTSTGNPPTTSYTWSHGGSTISSGAVLDIHNMGRDKSGLYTCTASNTVGLGNANVSVNVQFLDRPELLVNKTEVRENETVSLTCNVKSNPTAELAIRNVDNNTVLVERDTKRLQFTIERVQCLHNGSFLCTARNTQTGNASNSTLKEIDVKCSPRQDFRHKLDNIVVKKFYETAALVADIIANPGPEFRWFKQVSENLTNISRDTIHSISNSHLQSVLYINISRTQDYGVYVLDMKNSQGRSQLLFTLSSEALPKPPNEVTVEDVTYNSLTIFWRSNDNGGASQTFNIEFRKMKGEWRLWSEGIVDPGKGKTQKSKIRSLQPGTQYEVLVFAQNLNGQSAKVVREVTTCDTSPCSSQQTHAIQGLGVGIGISVMIPVIIVILSLWCICNRRESKNQKRENIDNNDLPLQQNSATGVQQTYTDLTMTESTVNEYEQLQVP